MLKKLEDKGIIKFQVNEGDEQVHPFIELMSIFVKPEFRRQGNGTKLIKMLRTEAKKRDINTIYVKVTKTNLEFKKFLDKNGFLPHEEKELFYGRALSLFGRVARKARKLH